MEDATAHLFYMPETDESGSVSPNLIAKTYHSIIETGQWEGTKAVVKKFRHQDNPRTPQRWRNEVDALNLVGAHDNIAQILASDASTLTITLRHEPGRSLNLYVDSPTTRKCTLTPSDSNFLWQQMSDALAYLHSKSVTHDDVKPDNIIWDGVRKRAVLIDFGVALVNRAALPGDVWTPSGTPPYAPPEFLLKRKYDAGDVWGLGVTMLFAFRYIPLPDGE